MSRIPRPRACGWCAAAISWCRSFTTMTAAISVSGDRRAHHRFAIPGEQDFTLIGTTDKDQTGPGRGPIAPMRNATTLLSPASTKTP